MNVEINVTSPLLMLMMHNNTKMCQLCKLQILNSFCTRWGKDPVATLEYMVMI